MNKPLLMSHYFQSLTLVTKSILTDNLGSHPRAVKPQTMHLVFSDFGFSSQMKFKSLFSIKPQNKGVNSIQMQLTAC